MTRTYDPADRTNPEHYRDARGECIDAMPGHFREWIQRAYPNGQWSEWELRRAVQWMMLGFCIGSAFKYRWRKGRKDDPKIEEGKAVWYDGFAAHVLDPSNPDPRERR